MFYQTYVKVVSDERYIEARTLLNKESLSEIKKVIVWWEKVILLVNKKAN